MVDRCTLSAPHSLESSTVVDFLIGRVTTSGERGWDAPAETKGTERQVPNFVVIFGFKQAVWSTAVMRRSQDGRIRISSIANAVLLQALWDDCPLPIWFAFTRPTGSRRCQVVGGCLFGRPWMVMARPSLPHRRGFLHPFYWARLHRDNLRCLRRGARDICFVFSPLLVCNCPAVQMSRFLAGVLILFFFLWRPPES